MAAVDDATFLLPFIRRAFITGDDTSFCERVIGDENVAPCNVLQMLNETFHSKSQSTDNTAHSPEISVPQRRSGNTTLDTTKRRLRTADAPFGNSKTDNIGNGSEKHRKLKTTRRFAGPSDSEREAGRSERPDAATSKANTTESIQLNMEVNSKLSQRVIDELFLYQSQPNNKNLIAALSEASLRPQSLCSSLLEEGRRRSEANPFIEFGRFDARGTPTGRTYEIFYAFASEARNSQKVTVAGDTLVRETIGYAMLCYVQQRREPSLQLPPGANCKSEVSRLLDSFDLFIADDDGSAELDFPRLEPNDQIGKYDFVRLALVRRDVVFSRAVMLASRVKMLDAIEFGELVDDDERVSAVQLQSDRPSDRATSRFESQAADSSSLFEERDRARSGSEVSTLLFDPVSPSRRIDTAARNQATVDTAAAVETSYPILQLSGSELTSIESTTQSEAEAIVLHCTLMKRKKLFAIDAVLRITANLIEIEPTKAGGATRLWSNLSGVIRRKCYRHFLEHIVTCSQPERVSRNSQKMTVTLKCLTSEQVFLRAHRVSQHSLISPPILLTSSTSSTIPPVSTNSGPRHSVGAMVQTTPKFKLKTHVLEMEAENAERACTLINERLKERSNDARNRYSAQSSIQSTDSK